MRAVTSHRHHRWTCTSTLAGQSFHEQQLQVLHSAGNGRFRQRFVQKHCIKTNVISPTPLSVWCALMCFNINGPTPSQKPVTLRRSKGCGSRAPPVRWREPLGMSRWIIAQERGRTLRGLPISAGWWQRTWRDAWTGAQFEITTVAWCFVSSICAGQAQAHNVTRFMAHQCAVLVADAVHWQD